MNKPQRTFEKSIFIQSSEKRKLYFVPEFILQLIYFFKKSWHQFECSQVFYMQRFKEEHPNWIFLIHGSPSRYLKKRGRNIYLYPYLKDVNQRYLDLVSSVNLEGLSVVDLNAGHGNLINYLPKTTHYRGNDIYPEGKHVEMCTDEIFVKTIDKVDVLCIFGWVTGGVFVESTTQDDSLKYLLTIFKPRYFVLESIAEYQILVVTRFADFLQNYEVLATFEYDVGGRHPKRTMLVFELKGGLL